MDGFSEPSETDQDTPPAPEGADNEEADENTALLPKSLFGTHKCKPGDVYRVRVVAVHGDDEIEVESAQEAKDSDDSSEMDKAQTGISAMAKEGDGY